MTSILSNIRDRYFNHDVLNKHAEKQKKEIQVKMEQFRELTSQNPDFLLEAVDLLIECRRILKYTYAYGFYLSEGAAKNFFEYLQANAEGMFSRLRDGFPVLGVGWALIRPSLKLKQTASFSVGAIDLDNVRYGISNNG